MLPSLPDSLYKAVFDGMRDPILIVDAQHRLVDGNRASVELLGLDPRFAASQPLAALPPLLQAVLDSSEDSATPAIVLPAAAGPRVYSVVVTALPAPPGAPVLLLLHLHNVLEETERESSLAQRQETLALRQQMEIALSNQDARLRSLIDNTDDIIWALDGERRLIVANSAFQENMVARIGRRLAPGESFDLVHASLQLRAEWAGYLERAVAGEQFSIEFCTGLAPHAHYLDYRFHPLRNANSQIVGVVISGRDVTERKQAEEALSVNLAKYAAIFQVGPMGLSITDDAGQLIECNRESERLLGLSSEEHNRRTYNSPEWTIIRPDGTPMPASEYASVRAHTENRPIENVEMGIVKRPGDVTWISASAAPIPLPGYGVAVAYLDISARRAMEVALRQSEERYRMLADDAPLPVVASDWETGRIVYANQQAADLYEMPLAETTGLAASDFYVNPSQFQELIERLRAGDRINNYECPILTRGGQLRWIAINASLSIFGGRPAVFSVSADITQRRQQEEQIRMLNVTLEERVRERTGELAAANALLQDALSVKDEFLSTMSHELRTPLTGVLSMAEVMQEQVYGPLSDRQLRCIALIEQSGRHLLDLINDILDISRADSGRLKLDLTLFAVEEVCRASTHMVLEMARRKQQMLRMEIVPAMMQMMGDQRRIKQILVNLLGNAVKFTPEGGTITLAAQGDPASATVTFSVVDTGVGIAAVDIPRLFQPFVQLDSSLARQYVGTGLGLALVRRLAELHGGSVGVESAPAEGSRFCVTLPWSGGASAVEAADAGAAAPAAPAVAANELILLVDDDAINASVFRDYLHAHGYRVTFADDGQSALHLCDLLRPDLILMDIQMPGMNGLEAIRRIRSHADAELAQTPIIAVTALAMPTDRLRSLAAGADDYVSKPMSMSALMTAVERQLQVRR